MNSLRSRRLLALLTLALALSVSACSGGDAIPDEPAEDAGTSADDGTLGGDGVEDPPEGVNQPLPDTGDDLEEPTP